MQEKFYFIKNLAEARYAIEKAYQGCYLCDFKLQDKFKCDINTLEIDYPHFQCLFLRQTNNRLHTVTIYNDFETSERCATIAMRQYLTLKYGQDYIDALKDHDCLPLEKLVQEQK